MSRGDAPEDIDEFEVKIDWVVCDGLDNGLEPEEMKKVLREYHERLDDENFIDKFS